MFTPRERVAELTQWQGEGAVKGVALLLPGGFERSRRGPSKIAQLGLRDLAGELTERGRAAGIAVHMLCYRFGGWNGAAADTAVDTDWALAELGRRYGDVSVVLVGNSLGGRAAFWSAGHSAVVGVAGIAPWLPESDPVEQLAGRRVLIIHGDRDRSTASAARSLAYARRAREVVPELVRYEVPGGSHFLVKRTADINALTTDFVLAAHGEGPSPATAATGGGLGTPLPSRSARRR
ncbi:alpha/beta hydrolase [Streptomyces racemochromogenes]|uniref:Alpha/beta hydrolase n=1 Tax=Streptomyces racemochromogenes TaxID=67353 RepID=A0ABW7PBN7_9ACTN